MGMNITAPWRCVNVAENLARSDGFNREDLPIYLTPVYTHTKVLFVQLV